MRARAFENLSAARLLLEDAEPHPNAAASRAYYAAYQACWSRMEDEGFEPASERGGQYFRHDRLPGEAEDAGVLTGAQALELKLLRGQRIRADYYPADGLVASEGRAALDDARALVEALLGPEEDA